MARRGLLFLGLGILVLAVVYLGYDYYRANLRVEPEKLLTQALEQARAAASYRYEVEAEMVVNGQRRVLSKVAGERDRQGNFHFWGELAGEKVEVYQFEGTTYFLDPQSGKWLVVPGNELGRQQMLVAEIDPLSHLNFASLGAVAYRGRERQPAGRMHVLEFRPQPANAFMNRWFEDFTYRVWIEARSRELRQVVIQARSKTNPQAQATFCLRLRDFGAKLKFSPPPAA